MKIRNLTNEERNEIVEFLLKFVDTKNKKNGLKNGSIKLAANKYNCSSPTVNRIWKRACENLEKDGIIYADSRIKEKSGRKAIDRSETLAALRDIPMCDGRPSIRTLSETIGIPRTSLYALLKKENIDTSRKIPTQVPLDRRK